MSYQQDVFQLISSIIGQNNNVVLPIQIIDFTGDYHTAALLSQLIYWQGKQKDPDGWIYKTYDQWQAEIRLSKYQTSRSAKALEKMGILETKVARVKLDNGMFGDKAVHYRLKQGEFAEKFTKHLSIVDSKETSLSKVEDLNYPKSSNLTNLSINTENTNIDYDDVPPPDPDPIPPQAAEPSSFSKEDLNILMQALPQDKKSKPIENRLSKSLKKGVIVDYLLDCITYSDDKKPKNFLSYLGNCIDKGYAPEGYHQAVEDARRRQKENAVRQEQAQQEEKKEKSALDTHNERVNTLLEQVDIQALDEFIGNQDLSQIERQRFQQGKRAMLRRKYVIKFSEQLS